MQRLEVSGAVRPIYGSLGVKRLISRQSAQEDGNFISCMHRSPLRARR